MQPLRRALLVLQEIAREGTGLSLTDLAERLNIPAASVHRILSVLEEELFVTRSKTNRRYFLGTSARNLGVQTSNSYTPLAQPHSAIEDASRATGETVFLTSMVGDEAVCVALQESRSPLRLFVHLGQAMPLHAAASARVILAGMSDDEVRMLLGTKPLESYTSDTPKSASDVIEHLRDVRELGYDICAAELDDGVWAVAAPVRDSTGAVIASVTAAAPTHRVENYEARQRLIDVVVHSAQLMSLDLGWDADRSDSSR